MRTTFVDPYPEGSRRRQLFDNYLAYNRSLSDLIGTFYQWVDGSFVTQKIAPKDVDVATFIDYQVVDQFSTELLRFGKHTATPFRGIDAYLLPVYPPLHPKHSDFVASRAYWLGQFTETRKTRRGERLPKGCLQLVY